MAADDLAAGGEDSGDEDFVLLDAGAMLEIGSAAYSPFSPTTVVALGRDDLVPVEAEITAPGRALMPWSPVHPAWTFQDNGDLEIRWTRRSRAGTVWSDHVEVPLAEEIEKYRLELPPVDSSGGAIVLESEAPQVILSAAQIEPFLVADNNIINAKISQIGAYGLSEVLAIEIPL